MSLLETVWTHGVGFKAEYADNLVSTSLKGWGTTFVCKTRQSNWFHTSISTPVVVGGKRTKLSKLYVLFSTESGGIGETVINSIHLYDGKNKVKSLDNLHLTGNHSNKVEGKNTLTISPPIMLQSGLGISIGVSTSDGHNDGYPVSFAAVGADFVD